MDELKRIDAEGIHFVEIPNIQKLKFVSIELLHFFLLFSFLLIFILSHTIRK